MITKYCTLIVFVTYLVSAAGCKPVASVTEIDSTVAPIESKPLQYVGSNELTVGKKVPDFQVEALGGETLKLSQYLAEARGPTILLFDRAHW